MKKLMIVDGNSIVNRAFYGIRMLTNADGMYTNAIYGFLNILFKYLDGEKPDGLCVAFDLSAPTFRHKQFDAYKANRKGMPEELKQQMPVLKEVLAAMNVKMLSLEGYEADDIIGTVSRKCDEDGIRCVILTGDKDDLQLASDNTVIKLVTTKKGSNETVDYDRERFIQDYGINPSEFIDVKGLMGDSSDNIPGVSGIGEKTAFALIKEFKSIENLYENLESPSIKTAAKKKLSEGKDSAFLSKQLAAIDRNVPIETDVSMWNIKEYNNDELSKLFTKLGFKKLMERLIPKTENQPEIETCDSGKTAENIREKKVMYCFRLNGEYAAATCESDIAVMPEEEFKALLFDGSVKKIAHNLKELFSRFGIFENAAFDTMIAAYLDNPAASEYGIETVSAQYLGLTGVESPQVGVFAVIGLYGILSEKIEKYSQHELYYDIELPLVTVLADMEATGFRVNLDMLKSFGEQLGQRANQLEGDIYSAAGEEFNINSPKQLGTVLFEKLKLPPVKKTKTGYSTNAEVLERLLGEHPVIEMILEYRQLTKLKSTYADGLFQVADKETGRVHSSFNQTVTVTGRISSTEPNLQNIPVRTELGREIRKMFIAADGCVLTDADYSQIELRVLAHISDDAVMKETFNNNGDIHTETASQIFGTDRESVTPEQRSHAKTVNFGIVYGMSPFSLAKDLKIPQYMAKKYIEGYFERFSGVKAYMDGIVKKAQEDGYVTTLLNRRRYLPELSAGNFMTRSFGERVAMNTPIQGSAADIIKLAMVKVYQRLKAEGLKSKLVLQVHDELIIETPLDEAEAVKKILKTEMENAYKLNVPLKVDMNVGETWYDAK